MPISRFCLQWDNHPKYLSANLNKLYENQLCVDLKLLCETHSIGVHKCVLAACSPYFADRFTKSLDIVSVVMKGIKYPVIKSILEFMYTGETNVIEEYVDAVVETARFFKVRGLSGIVTEKIGISEIIRGTKQIVEPEFITKNHLVIDFTINKLNDYDLNTTNININEKSVDELLLLGVTRSESTEKSNIVQNDHFVKTILEQPEIKLDLNNSSFNKRDCSNPVNNGVKIISNVDYLSYINKKQNMLEESVSNLTQSLYIKDVSEIQDCDNILNMTNDDTFVSTNEVVPEVSEMLSSDMTLDALASEVMNCNEHMEADKINHEDLINPVLSNEVIKNSNIDQDESQSILKSSKVEKLLQGAGIPTDVPVFYEDKNGRYVQLSEKILDEIASGYQVIYQIIDEDGHPSELMLGNTNKQTLESQQQESTGVVYDKLVADAIASNESDETSIDVKEHICIEESIVAANEFLIHSDSQDEQMGFLVTTSDIVENGKIMFQETEDISLSESCPIISDVIETMKEEILSQESRNIIEKNNQKDSEATKLLEICTNELTDESLCSLKSKPLSILLTASDMIENKQIIIEDSNKMNLNDNCNLVFMEHIDVHCKQNEILEDNIKACSEKSDHFSEIHSEKASDFEESDNETDSVSLKETSKINIVDEICRSECAENTESDIQSSPDKFESCGLTLLPKNKKDLNSSSTSSKSTDDSSSDYRSELENQTVVYEPLESNIFQKNSHSENVSSCLETSDNYVSSIDPSKDSSTSLSSTSSSETERTPIRNNSSENIQVDETNDSIDSSLNSIQKTISTLNSVDYISILGLDKNLLTPSSSIDTSDSCVTLTESQPNTLKSCESKEEHIVDKSLNENTTSVLISNITDNENLQNSLLMTDNAIETNPMQEEHRNYIQESVEQKMERLHMEISVSDSSPNTLFEEIQKLKNSRKRSISENRNPFSDSDMSESNEQVRGINGTLIASQYNKCLQMSVSKKKKTLQEDDQNQETTCLENIDRLSEDIQRIHHNQPKALFESKVTNGSQFSKECGKKGFKMSEMKSENGSYLKEIYSNRRKSFPSENLINSIEMNAVDNSGTIQKQSDNLRNLNSNKSSNVRNIRKSNVINVRRTRLRKSSSSASDNSVNTGKEIPYALGLLPLNKALKKIQNMPEHKPRKTRSCIKLTKLKKVQSDKDAKQTLGSKLLSTSKLKLNVHRERIIKKTK